MWYLWRMPPPQPIPPETIGKRIARLRAEHGWTQQALATRLAVSRVAVSHLEMDLSVPSERTITLLAGLFKRSPYELVENTSYPQAKAEKLPATACAYTPLELALALLDNDLTWLKRLEGAPEWGRCAGEVLAKWRGWLGGLDGLDADEREQALAALSRLDAACEGQRER